MTFEQVPLVPTLQHAYDRGYAAGLKREADLLTALDELTAENKELKLDLAAAEHYTTDDLTSPARLCVKCRCPWPCEFTFRAVVGEA